MAYGDDETLATCIQTFAASLWWILGQCLFTWPGWIVIIGSILSIPYLLTWFIIPLFTGCPPDLRARKARCTAHGGFLDPKALDPRSSSVLHKVISRPSLEDEPTVDVSLVVPAYNEQSRLPTMIEATVAYLQTREKRTRDRGSATWEVIVVDDGSTDSTVDVALMTSHRFGVEQVRVLPLGSNHGKGWAVKQGMLVARGAYLLMVDADGATDIEDFQTLFDEMQQLQRPAAGKPVGAGPLGVCIGSRKHLDKGKRTWHRNVLTAGFAWFRWGMGVRNIQDTQCGFKLFSRQAARMLFPTQHLRRWCFDVELLYLAQRQRIPIAEVPVNWTEIAGSKVNRLTPVKMLFEMIWFRLNYLFGYWRIN